MLKIETKPLSRDEQAIHDRACSRAKRYLQSEFELLESIGEVDESKLYEKFGLTSTFSYCLKKLNLTEAVTSIFIRVARKNREVPELKLAIESGDLSASKAVQICGILTPENKEEWITKATELPKAQLEKAVAEAAPEKPKRSTAKPVGKNRTRVQFEGDDEFIEMLNRARELESQRKAKPAKIEEALKAALEIYLEKRDPVKKAERAQKRAVKVQALAAVKPAPPEHFDGREHVSAALRHELNLRDRGGCQVRGPDGEICGATLWIDFHHIIQVQHGGKNELGNLITVCEPHHRLIHQELMRH